MKVFLSSTKEFCNHDDLWGRWKALPQNMIEKFERFHFEEDAQRFLLGKILALYAIRALGYEQCAFSEIKYSRHRKPYFTNEIDFNISHSGDLVGCVATKGGKIGIDIEQVSNIQIDNFRNFCSDFEWDFITRAEDRTKALYTVWTRKEAVLKANGIGLVNSLQSINALKPRVFLLNENYYVSPIGLPPGYVGHLASTKPISENNDEKNLVTFNYCNAKDLINC